MLEVARPGMPGMEIVAEMERVVRREGADHAKYWMASGPPPDWNNYLARDQAPRADPAIVETVVASCSYIVYQGDPVPWAWLPEPWEFMLRCRHAGSVSRSEEAHDRAQ